MTAPPTDSTRRDEPAREHRVELEATPAEALEAVEQASEIWGGEWRREGTGGTLTLPVSAGLRHGHVHGQVTTESRGARSALAFRIERIYYRVHVPAIVILLVGLFGGLLVVFAGLSSAALRAGAGGHVHEHRRVVPGGLEAAHPRQRRVPRAGRGARGRRRSRRRRERRRSLIEPIAESFTARGR